MQLITTHICMGRDVGIHGNAFGGVILAWIDEAAGAFAGQCCDTQMLVTKSISKVNFERPVRPGQIIKVYGEVERVGNTSITLNIDVRRHSVYNGSQKTVCSTNITFVCIDDAGEPAPLSQKVRNKFAR